MPLKPVGITVICLPDHLLKPSNLTYQIFLCCYLESHKKAFQNVDPRCRFFNQQTALQDHLQYNLQHKMEKNEKLYRSLHQEM
jgi:hypothetical protein